jgi:hypothetical protein
MDLTGVVAGHVDELPIPIWYLPGYLVDKCWKSTVFNCQTERGSPRYLIGNFLYEPEDPQECRLRKNITATDRDDRALLEVGAKAGDLAKCFKDASKVVNIFS